MADPPGSQQVMPRGWIGTSASCDVARRTLNWVCLNVDAKAHTTDTQCHHIPLLGTNGYVDQLAWQQIQQTVLRRYAASVSVLMHDTTGFGPAGLAIAMWLRDQQLLSLDQAYQWLWKQRPDIQDLRKLTAPVYKDSVFHG